MLNIVALQGRLTADIELKQTPSGVSVATFNLAVQRSFSKQGEERQTDFINIVAWRNTAEFAAKYFTKGQLMVIDGFIQTRTFKDKDTGKNRVAFEVVASNINFCEGKADSNNSTKSFVPANGLPNVENDSDFTPIDDNEDLPF